MRFQFSFFAIVSVLCATTALAAPGPVTDKEVNAFVQAAEQKQSKALESKFHGRVVRMKPGLVSGRTDESDFLNTVAGCKLKKTTRFGSDPDVFIEWMCPQRPWNGSRFEMAGVVVNLKRNADGLVLAYAEQGVAIPGVSVPPPLSPQERG